MRASLMKNRSWSTWKFAIASIGRVERDRLELWSPRFHESTMPRAVIVRFEGTHAGRTSHVDQARHSEGHCCDFLRLARGGISFRPILSEPTDQARAALPAWWADRWRGAADRGKTVRFPRPDRCDREPCRRRWWHRRREVGRDRGPRRLHAPVHAARSAGDGAADL